MTFSEILHTQEKYICTHGYSIVFCCIFLQQIKIFSFFISTIINHVFLFSCKFNHSWHVNRHFSHCSSFHQTLDNVLCPSGVKQVSSCHIYSLFCVIVPFLPRYYLMCIIQRHILNLEVKQPQTFYGSHIEIALE